MGSTPSGQGADPIHSSARVRFRSNRGSASGSSGGFKQAAPHQSLRETDLVQIVFERPGAFEREFAGLLCHSIVDLFPANKRFRL
jgi:hypothetical protein